MALREDRKSHRTPVTVETTCRSAWRKLDCALTNLSREGCCFAGNVSCLQVGNQVTLRLASAETLEGKVLWVEAEHAGVVFEQPLYAPLFNHLLRLHGNSESPETSEASEIYKARQ